MTVLEPQSSGHARFLAEQAARVAAIRDQFAEWYPDPVDLTLEIGCGHGHYLSAYASQHVEQQCLGIDLVSKRIRKACAKRDKRDLANLQFLKADVREVLMAWPGRFRLERVFILFPDPWPKKRHTKNRILQTQLLDQLADSSSPGTSLHFRTDHEDHFAYGLDLIAGHPAWEVSDEAEWPFENPSFFQDLLGKGQSLTALYSSSSSDVA